MQNKNILSVLAVAVLGLTMPILALPTAHAYHDDVDVELTGTTSFSDPFFGGTIDGFGGSVVAGRENTAVTFNVKIITSETIGQRNLTVGVRFDWMTSWTNASNANPTTTLLLGPNEYATVSVSVTLPAAASNNLYLHSWELRVWSDQLNMPVTNGSCFDGGLKGVTCFGESRFAIYNAGQYGGLTARDEADAKLDALSIYLSTDFLGLAGAPAGWSQAVADASRARAELSAGHELYADGDFSNALTHYQNALSLANSASTALSSGGGGEQSASFTNMLLGGIGTLLAGTGIVLAGIGGLVYLNRRSKVPKA